MSPKTPNNFVRTIVIGLLLSLCPVTAFAGKPKPPLQFEHQRIRVSKKTTFILGPLRKDGMVDFAAALNARGRKGVTPEKNAAVLIAQIVSRSLLDAGFQKEFYEELGIPKGVKPRPRMLTVWEFAKRAAGDGHEAYVQDLIKQRDESLTRLWSRKELPKLAAWLNQNETPLAVVRKAVQRPQWFCPIIQLGDDEDYHALLATPMPLTQSSQEFAQMLTANAMLAVQEGRNSDAINDLLACHRLARLVAKGPFTLGPAYGYAIERMVCRAEVAILQSGKLNAADLKRLQKSLFALPPLPSCAETINWAERLTMLDAVIHVKLGGFRTLAILSDLSNPKDWSGIITWRIFSFLTNWNRLLEMLNAEFNRVYAAVKKEPYAKRKAALDAYWTHHKRLRASLFSDMDTLWWRFFNWGRLDFTVFTRLTGKLIISLLMPSFHLTSAAEDEARTRLQLVRVAVALERHRVAHGKYPAKLSALRPGFMKELPNDPFAGKPFQYKPAKTGYRLYSIGPNARDDEGKPSDPDAFTSDGPDDVVVHREVAPKNR